MKLSRTQLLIDLHTAYLAARRHKRQKEYQKMFEADMENNLSALADELFSRNYQPKPSVCFVIEDPKKREVFAADFRDRIVHHLYYNYTHELFERGFIADSYSCIKKRGTHYGVSRLEKFIRRQSLDYAEKCYILKMDISGYFMHIDRSILLSIVLRRLNKMRSHRVSCKSPTKWNDVLDFDFIDYLSRCIVMLNPIENCVFRGNQSEWDTLPFNRSLFNSPENCGLPIGNLTSQLFSNVYLGELDDFVKRTLKVVYYGRYVDDFYVVSTDKYYLRSLIPKITHFLCDVLKLKVNTDKTVICNSNYGVGFLGAYLKPHRKYLHNITLRHIKVKLSRLNEKTAFDKLQAVVNSYLGLFSHCNGYNLSKKVLLKFQNIEAKGFFLRWMKKYVKLNAD